MYMVALKSEKWVLRVVSWTRGQAVWALVAISVGLGACSTQHLTDVRLPPVPVAPVQTATDKASPDLASRVDRATRGGIYGRAGEPSAFNNEQLWAQLRFLAASVNTESVHHAHLQAFGRSHLNAPLWALRLSDDPAIEPSRKPSVLLLAQQHGDEAGSAQVLVNLARSVHAGELDDVLEQVDLLFVPRLNPDGFAAGRQANAQGLDIDRDHLLMQTPEAQALAHLMRAEEPLVFVELTSRPQVSILIHADEANGLSIRAAPARGVPPFLARAAREWFRDPVIREMAQDPEHWGRGVNGQAWAAPAWRPNVGADLDTLLNVTALRNTVSLSLAFPSHGGAAPVQAVTDVLHLVLRKAASRVDDLLKLRHYVRREVAELACRGALPINEDEDNRLSLRPCGYWLSADAKDAVRRLRTVGLEVVGLDAPAEVLGDEYRTQPRPGEKERIGLMDALIDMPAGSFYVSLNQPLANLAVMALEPTDPDGYVARGVIADLREMARARWPLRLAHDEMAMPLRIQAP